MAGIQNYTWKWPKAWRTPAGRSKSSAWHMV